jgi:hypothetical protein
MRLNTRHNLCAAGLVWFGYLLLADITQDHSPLSTATNVEMSYEWLKYNPMQTSALDHLAALVDTPGDHSKARVFFNLAAQRSLRDVVAQAHAIDDLLAAANYEPALQRINAVLRQQNLDPQPFYKLILTLASDRSSLPAVTGALAANPPWRGNFIRFAAEDNSFADALYKILSSLHAQKKQVSDDEIQLYLKGLIKHQNIEKANFVWLDFLAAGNLKKAGLVYDGGFSQTPRNQFFDWTFSPLADVAIGLAPRAGDRGNFALGLDFSQAKPTQILVSQYLMLTAGTYMLRGDVNATLMQGESDLQWELRCMEKTSATATTPHFAEMSAWTSFEMPFTIPAEGCTYQKLVLRSKGTAATALSGQIYFDNLSVTEVASNDG